MIAQLKLGSLRSILRSPRRVKVEATVSADGKVTDVRTVSGNHMLAPAAEDAVRKWKFVQGDGESMVTVDVGFTID